MRPSPGLSFFVTDPKPEDIKIMDIAHALSNQCRFTGHCRDFYSVAQHCVLAVSVAERLKKTKYLREILLHDASEAYLADMARPVKKFMMEYKGMEQALEDKIASRFGLIYPWPQDVKVVDNAMLFFEAHALGFKHVREWHFPNKPKFTLAISPWKPTAAKKEFLDIFMSLFPNFTGSNGYV